jgi:hypothetical protein
MSDAEATRQSDWITPPRKNNTWVLSVSNVSAATDLSALTALTGYLSAQADGADVYFAFGADNTVTVDDTTTGTPATGGAPKIPANGVFNFKPVPSLDKFIAVKTASGSAKIRIWPSSPPRLT